MAKTLFFYDYICPFCEKGYEYLLEEIGRHPEIEVEYVPVQVNSPAMYLACQAYYAAKELEADMGAFHAAMYKAAVVQGKNLSMSEAFRDVLKGIVDVDKFRAILDSGKYAKQVDENNDLAYEKSGVWFLPAFRTEGKKLDAKGGRGISPQELRDFFR